MTHLRLVPTTAETPETFTLNLYVTDTSGREQWKATFENATADEVALVVVDTLTAHGHLDAPMLADLFVPVLLLSGVARVDGLIFTTS